MSKRLLIPTVLLGLLLFGVYSCYQMEVTKIHSESYTNEVEKYLPSQLQIKTATNFHIHYEFDSNDLWVKMTLPNLEAVPELNKPASLNNMTERQKWGFCKKQVTWWTERPCDSPNIQVYFIDIPPPYPAAKPIVGVVGVSQSTKQLIFYEPPAELK